MTDSLQQMAKKPIYSALFKQNGWIITYNELYS